MKAYEELEFQKFVIVGAFHHLPESKQMFIVMYKDLLTNLKITFFIY